MDKVSNVKEPSMQCEDYNFRTGTKISANRFASSCWEEPIINNIGLCRVFSLCVLASHTFAVVVSLWVEPYHKHYEVGYFVFTTSARYWPYCLASLHRSCSKTWFYCQE